MNDKILKENEINQLLKKLEERFDKHMYRHENVSWKSVEDRLFANKQILWTISQMEFTEGEPDLLVLDNKEFVYCDCSSESPKGRRSLCYDKMAWESRKENKPIGNAIDMAKAMGIEILTQDQYFEIQKIEDFDLKTSSWLLTPEPIRSKKGAIFGDKRYDQVFIYHNGAESYYAARGFRGLIRI